MGVPEQFFIWTMPIYSKQLLGTQYFLEYICVNYMLCREMGACKRFDSLNLEKLRKHLFNCLTLFQCLLDIRNEFLVWRITFLVVFFIIISSVSVKCLYQVFPCKEDIVTKCFLRNFRFVSIKICLTFAQI